MFFFCAQRYSNVPYRSRLRTLELFRNERHILITGSPTSAIEAPFESAAILLDLSDNDTADSTKAFYALSLGKRHRCNELILSTNETFGSLTEVNIHLLLS